MDSTNDNDAVISWVNQGGSTDSCEVATQYDAWAETYECHLDEWGYDAPEVAAGMLGRRIPPESRILDAGCGTGLTGKALSRAGFSRIVGLDISARSLECAAAHQVYTDLVCHDLQQIPFPFGADDFDAACCIGVLAYIEEARDLFAELCRMVRPGGRIVFSQRHDLFVERDYPRVLSELSDAGEWRVLHVSEPRSYLPGNAAFGAEVQVRYVVCRVGD